MHSGKLKTASAAIILLCISLVIIFAVDAVESSWDSGVSLRESSVEDSIKEAAVYCYSIEGRYPESIDYLAQYYGILIDNDMYNYYYRYIGANLMPEIKVSAK